jgi:FKBP12-rapamycin complex-associated protein
MVGYILGLGDRHPNNLMLNRNSGKVIHIDFGDCFEVAMLREKFAEKVPFRLTRMLVSAMEVAGIRGTFTVTCESVMRVLRDNKESMLAVLEAFVYDPLINWRLIKNPSLSGAENIGDDDHEPNFLVQSNKSAVHNHANVPSASIANSGLTSSTNGPPTPARENHPHHTNNTNNTNAVNEDYQFDEDSCSEDAIFSESAGTEQPNVKAIRILDRVSAKLSGRDFDDVTEPLDVSHQVELLIKRATSNLLLCQSYLGWCPYW